MRLLFYGILIIISLAISYWFGSNISFSRQLILLDTLQNISAIIITIIGIWIAVIYPQYLANINKDSNFINFKELLVPIYIAIFILIMIILIKSVGVTLQSLNGLEAYTKILRQVSFAIILLLNFLQIIGLLTTFLPIVSLYKNINRRKNIMIKNKKNR